MPEEKIASTRFFVSLIQYLSSASDRDVDLYSFLVGKSSSAVRDNRLINYVQENNEFKPTNRLFITIVLKDDGLTVLESMKLITDASSKIKRTFYGVAEIPKHLSDYSPDCTYEFISDKPGAKLNNYIILVFNFPDKSSVEFVITAYGLNKNSKLFEGKPASIDTIERHISYWEEKKPKKRRKN